MSIVLRDVSLASQVDVDSSDEDTAAASHECLPRSRQVGYEALRCLPSANANEKKGWVYHAWSRTPFAFAVAAFLAPYLTQRANFQMDADGKVGFFGAKIEPGSCPSGMFERKNNQCERKARLGHLRGLR